MSRVILLFWDYMPNREPIMAALLQTKRRTSVRNDLESVTLTYRSRGLSAQHFQISSHYITTCGDIILNQKRISVYICPRFLYCDILTDSRVRKREPLIALGSHQGQGIYYFSVRGTPLREIGHDTFLLDLKQLINQSIKTSQGSVAWAFLNSAS